MKFKTPLIIATAMSLFAGLALAQSIGKPEDQIRWRQAAYQSMAWSMGRVKANLEGQYDSQQVAQAANVIRAIANSGLGKLYGPGTDKGKGFHPTRAKAALFTDGKKVGELAMNFNKEANALAEIAELGDKAEVAQQFDKLAKACKACHKDYREDDD